MPLGDWGMGVKSKSEARGELPSEEGGRSGRRALLSAGVASAIVIPGVFGWRVVGDRETSTREMKVGPGRALEGSAERASDSASIKSCETAASGEVAMKGRNVFYVKEVP